ncbi:MmpS family transport accessory protein [Micromonospora soli]|uniref:MmpS family transport accessory protein n=1 Tax=Micromonospora sp. NBRC 110009 TaxID=3061627 RepID=UPI00267314AB|nr:MmpS family transport accessory protein [Micromonospora sp. NBRC 110009]WKU01692.1 MmpS family transport accessory protein [Micromonospora sp. NBRC 110009]
MATVVVLVFCGCLSMGVLGPWYGDSYDGHGNGEPGGGATAEAPFPVPSRHPATQPSGGPGELSVVYEVTGVGPVDLQYYDANGDYIENERVTSPWRLQFTTNRTDRGLMVLAQLSEPNEIDRATCRIIVDGNVVAEDSGVYGGDCFA